MLLNMLVNNKSRLTQKINTIYAILTRKLYQKNLYREKIVYDEEANNFYNIIEPHYKCYDKDYEKNRISDFLNYFSTKPIIFIY